MRGIIQASPGEIVSLLGDFQCLRGEFDPCGDRFTTYGAKLLVSRICWLPQTRHSNGPFAAGRLRNPLDISSLVLRMPETAERWVKIVERVFKNEERVGNNMER